MTSKSDDARRVELIEHVRLACELEHSLCCQYLYAGFSLRRRASDFGPDVPDEQARRVMAATQRWASQIFYVAREEMEHLGIALNLLAAIGEPPHLGHAPFPDDKLASVLRLPCWLERCNEDVLRRFQYVERPGGLDLPSLDGPEPPPTGLPAVEQVYDFIQKQFETLPSELLFRGDGLRQVDEGDIELGVAMQILPVTTRASAVEAIALVLKQGEGLAGTPVEDSHFSRFSEILASYRALASSAVEPSLPVARNPVLDGAAADVPYTEIENPLSRALMQLFNRGYRLMVMMLRDFFADFRGYSGAFEAVEALASRAQLIDDRRVTIMAENAFFPFMTMFVRPLGELLARSPAGDPTRLDALAGAPFDTLGPIVGQTDMPTYLELLSELEAEAEAVARAARGAPANPLAPTLVDDLDYLAQNLHRIRKNVYHVWTYKA